MSDLKNQSPRSHLGFSILMRRFGYCKLDKEKRKHGKDRRLYESDEDFKCHERDGNDVRSEEKRDRDQDFAGKNVSKETEGKRNQADEFGDEFDDAHEKRQESRRNAMT